MQTERLKNLWQRRASRARSAALFALTLILTVAATANNRPSIVGAATVRTIESKVIMPRRTTPLADYDRYYMLKTMTPKGYGPRDVVEGRFMLRELGTHFRKGAVAVPGIANAFTVERGGTLPDVAHGGCDVVTIFFDIASGSLVEIQTEYEGAKPSFAVCNGRG